MDVLDLFARAQIVQYVVNEVQQFEHEISCRHFFLFTEINHLTFQSPAHSAPLVFLNEHAPVETEAEILFHQLRQLGNNGLEQRGDSDRVIDARGDVADAKLQGRKNRMRPAVPPDLFAVVDAASLYQQLDITLEPR